MRLPHAVAAVLVVAALAPAASLGDTVKEFSVSADRLTSITTGADGSMWVAAKRGIGKLSSAGALSFYTVSEIGDDQVTALAVAPDGRVLGGGQNGHLIRINGDGAQVLRMVSGFAAMPTGASFLPDGRLWMMLSGQAQPVLIDPLLDVVGLTTLQQRVWPDHEADPIDLQASVIGPDNALWAVDTTGDRVVRFEPLLGGFTTFDLPRGGFPTDIAVGPDGAFWITEDQSNKIVRMTTGGAVTEFAIPTKNSAPRGIAAGADGALHFTEYAANKIGRITTDGQVSEVKLPTAGSGPWDITAGPEGKLWATQALVNKVVQVTPGASKRSARRLSRARSRHRAR